MKKYTALILMALCLLLLCSCNNSPDADTTSSQTTDNSTEEYKQYLWGDWISASSGECEPIDEKTVNGTPYTIKDITRDAQGNLTYALKVGDNDAIYKIYRYKVGYAEYSYMEATVGAKDVVFIFHK